MNLSVDVSDAQEMLRETYLSIPSIEGKVMRLVGKLTGRETIKAVKATVNTSSHSLLAHRYTYNTNKMFTYGKVKNHSLAVYPKPLTGGTLIIPVVTTLNYGYDAGSARGPHVVGRGFVQAGEVYAKSKRYMPIVQQLVDAEIEKFNRKFQ